jgi:kynurenine formamidase
MGKKILVDLSHPFGAGCPLWPYFEDVVIDRKHYMAKSGVLSQKVSTVMHVTTHADSPAHVIEGAPFTHEIPLDRYYGDAVCWDIPKNKWELVLKKDLDEANKKLPIKADDIVIIHTGWNKYWSDSQKYFLYSPGLGREAGEWFVEHKVKAVGVDQQALDHPLHTAIAPHGTGPIRKDVCEEYKRETGRDVLEDFPEWEPCHNLILGHGILGWENVGGDIAKVVGKRFKIMGFPIRWYLGDGSIVRLVAEIDEDDINKTPDRVYPYGVV